MRQRQLEAIVVFPAQGKTVGRMHVAAFSSDKFAGADNACKEWNRTRHFVPFRTFFAAAHFQVSHKHGPQIEHGMRGMCFPILKCLRSAELISTLDAQRL